MKTIFLILITLSIAACSTSGRPLPLIDKADPTFALAPDHLEFGSLPK